MSSDLDDLAMPQPLSRVSRNASFRHNPAVLDDKPELARHVSRIFAHWGLIEYRLSLLLVRVLGADAAPAIAMFSTLTAQHLQLGALEAAAKAALTEHEFEVFSAMMRVTDMVAITRHQLAHWIWGSCNELPDALLLADPRTAKERDREFLLVLERYDKDGINVLEAARLNSYDPDRVNVYRLGDLKRADRDLTGASDIAFLTVIYLDGLFRGRRNHPKIFAHLQREQLFQQLYGKRLFREAWDQIQKGRGQNSRPPPHGSPPPEPNGS